MYELSASIVTYENDKDILGKAIDSFLRSGLKTHLYVVDNSPTDVLKNTCARGDVEYIFNNANLGFGSGHNLALRLALGKSKYHLILNPDIYFGSGVLEKLFQYMENHEDIGLIAPKICYFDGSPQYLCKLLPSPLDLFLRRIGPAVFKKIFRRRLDDYELKFTGYDKIMNVPHLSGCFMFLRTNIFKRVEFFDERFFMYLEDVDFSRRIHRHYRTVYFPEAIIYHDYKKGSYNSLKHFQYHIFSAVKYFNKWGWFFDKERRTINSRALSYLKAK